MTSFLEITIPDNPPFYSLYADGNHSWKTYDRAKKANLFYYPPKAAVILYYTYPTHRTASVIRFLPDCRNGLSLPGLSKKVSVLCTLNSSRVDKLRRSAGWLKNHSFDAFAYDDGFYIRLACLLEQRGKLNYTALRMLDELCSAQKQLFIQEV